MCGDGHAAFLPANHILSVSGTTSAPPLATTVSAPPVPVATRKKLLLSAARSAIDRDFYLDDEVVVFDKDGRRVSGVVKWAIPGKDVGLKSYIIGIETVRIKW